MPVSCIGSSPGFGALGAICTIITGTTSATIGTQTTHAHNLGSVPRAYFILERGAGVIYESIASDATNIYVKGTVASLNFTAVVFT